jgi:hypothetical protein
MTFLTTVARGLARPTLGRRGALLLLVLSVLTLFMMIGTLMLVLAMRARTTARAFADATAAADSLLPQAMLDEALMVLLRGGASLPPQITESLLSDRYGQPTTGTAEAGSVAPLTGAVIGTTTLGAGVLLEARLTGLAPPVAHACDLNGRVLTLQPDPGDGDVASYRILRATGGSEPFTVYLANTTTARSTALPKKECRVIINGPEFLTEAHDSYDQDSWLAWIPLQDSRPVTTPTAIVRPSFSPSFSTPPAASGIRGPMPINALACDNDNDGVPDGVWIDGATGFLPPRPSPLGGTVRYRVSYHVLDLDGRINLNAHGSPVVATSFPADWAATSQGVAIGNVPVGLGYGPADVDVSRLLGPDTTPAVPGNQSYRLAGLMQATGNTLQAVTPTADQRRPAPALGSGIPGRYAPPAPGASVPRPGALGATQPPIALRALQGSSPTDLFARTRMFHSAPTAGAPTLYFYSPARADSDVVNDPYQLRLDVDGPRGGVIKGGNSASPPADSPFTEAELEGVLRPFDADASTLPPRLAAVLDDYAERSRLTVTTDSWDTPAMSGMALERVREYMMTKFPSPTSPLSNALVYGAMSPDVSAGLRFDVNRPLDHSAVPATANADIKQRYCRHLYTLLCALDPSHGICPPAEKAQWAVNVCDFRDADSTMTIFRYDTIPTDGWTTTTSSPVVIGAERPEVVITEAIAWNGHASVVLYHPWDAKTTDRTGGTTVTERVDSALGSSNSVILSKTHNDLAAGSLIWRFRFDGGVTATFPSGSTSTLLANTAICVQTANPLVTTVAKTFSQATFKPPAASPANVKLILERLADPTKANDETTSSATYNPYVAVDEATVPVYADQAAAQTIERSSANGFWRSSFSPVTRRPPGNYPNRVPWFHWPNRPFVSVGELALVPSGNAAKMLADYQEPSGSQAFRSLATNPALLLLDAVHVPSRFVGTSQSIGLQPDGTCPLLVSAASIEHVCTTQLPRWREPGRVNVNTILPNTGNTSNSLLDDGVWKALAGDAAPANPFNSGEASKAADSFTKLLALSTAANRPPSAQAQAAPRNLDPFFTYSTAIRLANVATIRSHVFAVWITLEASDNSATAPPPSRHRLFAIVDRSIPVGFSPGENLNVRDTVRVLRYLD